MRKIINEYSKLFDIDIPIVNELVKTKEMQRLKDISYHCGMFYGPKDIYNFSECYTRLDHSVNGCKMYYLLTKDIKGCVAFLLHDIATPVFSHVIDIMEDDQINQEATEKYTKDIIKNSKEIKNILKKYKINIIDVLECKDYPIADNKRPKLCIDRLDAVFIDGLLWNKTLTINDVKYLFNNLKVFKVNGIEEIGFNNIKQAILFFESSITDAYFTDDICDTYAMAFLGDLVKILMDNEIITEEYLYNLKEKQMLRKIKIHKLTKNLYKKFMSLKRENIVLSSKCLKNYYCYKTETKKRYINPLVKNKGKVARIIDANNSCKIKLNDYLDMKKDKYVYNFKITLE